MHVDNWDPETYLWILEEVDVPYIKDEWDGLLKKYADDPKKLTSLTILGRYLSKMKLKQWNQYSWADTERLAEEAQKLKVNSMKAQGLTGEQIEEQLAIDRTPERPAGLASPIVGSTPFDVIEEEEDDIAADLSEEDKIYLRLKWGRSYRPDEWVRMEQLYQDMMKSYDIQSAGHKDTLIMVCKTSLKANQLLDAGEIDGYQKMAKVYDSLMKSGKFQAAQTKEENGESIDSIGELVAICEKEGFIPRYYVDSPKDQVDRTLQDMQIYTRTLVTEELNLGNMLESAVREIESDRAREATAVTEVDDAESDDDERLAAALFDEPVVEQTDQDYQDFEDFKESLREMDDEEDEW